MNNVPSSHHDALRELGGPAQVGRDLRDFDDFEHIEVATLESRVLGWSTRNNIPGPYWQYVEQIAIKKGRSDITAATLAKLCVTKRNKASIRIEECATCS